MSGGLPVQKMPKFKYPNNSPPVSKHWRSGAIPVQETASSEYAQRRRRDASADEGFQHWWREVRLSGALLPPEAEENTDYFGKMSWPEFVAFNSLYAAYAAIVGKARHEIFNIKQFRRALLQFTEIRYHGVRNVVVKTGTRRQIKRLETFYRTGEAPKGIDRDILDVV